MGLDRDELAARLGAANVSNNGDDVVDPAKWAAHVVGLADALLSRLAPAPSPAASPAPYVPQVGDVVSVMSGDGWTGTVVAPPDSEWRYIVHYHEANVRAGAHTRPPHLRYLRRATPAERAAAGLAAPASMPVDREGLALRLRVAEAVFGANDRAKNPDDYCRCQSVYVAALGAIGYDGSWATRSVSSFIEHLKANGGVA